MSVVLPLVEAASSMGGLFKRSPQDPYKSNPRASGLDLMAQGDPMVWVNKKQTIIMVSDQVAHYSVPPGGIIYQIPGGKPDSGKLIPGEGGTSLVQTAASAPSSASPAQTVGAWVRPGAQPQQHTIGGVPSGTWAAASVAVAVIVGLVVLASLDQ